MRCLRLIPFLLVAVSIHADMLAVANRGGTSITLVDPAAMNVIATVGVGTDPHEIAVGPDGRHVYVSNYGGGSGSTLSVVDLQTRTKVKDIPIAPLIGAHGIVTAAGKVWFTSENTGSIGRYDPATDRVDWIGRTHQGGSHMLAVRADGTVAYTGNIQSSTASIIPVSGSESSAKVSIPVVAAPEGIALSPDQRELWLGSRNFQGISIIDLATEKVVATIAGGTFAYRLYFSHDGKHVLVPRPGEVAVFDAAQRTLVRAIAVNSSPFSIAIAPDDRTAYVATGGPNQVLKIDFTTGEILARLPLPAVADGLAYALVSSEPQQPRRKRRAVTKGE
jgi:DNA-binding beta-propeller fold protein YncE